VGIKMIFSLESMAHFIHFLVDPHLKLEEYFFGVCCRISRPSSEAIDI